VLVVETKYWYTLGVALPVVAASHEIVAVVSVILVAAIFVASPQSIASIRKSST